MILTSEVEDSFCHKDELSVLRLMKQSAENLGVQFLMHYGFRCFLNTGEVFGTTTNPEWNIFINQESLKPTIVKDHYLKYLRLMDTKTFRYQIRRKEDADTTFLNHLVNAGMGNSLTIYARDRNSIKVYFFVADPNHKQAICFFYNNFHLFEKIVSYVDRHSSILSYPSYLTNITNEKLFSDYDAKLIFGLKGLSRDRVYKAVYFEGESYEFSQRQIQILDNIKNGYTLKSLSEATGLGLSGLNFHLSKIRKKIGGKYKQDLVQFANQMQGLI